MWCLLGALSAEFVCAMEDLLDVHTQPNDPMNPTVFVDEASKQLVGDVREPLPVSPGHPARYDFHYIRNGVAIHYSALPSNWCTRFLRNHKLAPPEGWKEIRACFQGHLPPIQQAEFYIEVGVLPNSKPCFCQ